MKNQLSLNEKIDLIKKTPSDVLVKNHLKDVFQTYHKLFGEVCSGCPHKIAGYIKRIRSYKKTRVMSDKNDTREFSLRKGVIIPIAGTSEAYSQQNLTDEIALKLIAKNPNRKGLFSKLPDDIDKKIASLSEGGENESVKIGDLRLTVEEAVAALETVDVSTRATTVSGVQKKVDALKKEQLETLLKNLEVDDKGKNEAVVIGESELTVEEAVEALKSIGVETKATTVDGVQKRVNELDDKESSELIASLSEGGENE